MNRIMIALRVAATIVFFPIIVNQVFAEPSVAKSEQGVSQYTVGWEPTAHRDETRPQFSYDANGGPRHRGSFVIKSSDSIGENGWFQKSFPVAGGTYVYFAADRKTTQVVAPFRSAVARIVWLDAKGKGVLAKVPSGLELTAGMVPLTEPEHPLDQGTNSDGWTHVEGTYQVPPGATQAIVELHLQWAPNGSCEWSEVRFEETQPPTSRKVRLATIHHVPSGRSPRDNCEEFAPLIVKAAKQHADLVVLGETIPYVGVKKQPHEVAEPVPGPTTDYFASLAKQHGIHLVVGLYERDEHVVYNVAALLGPDGHLIGKYRKVCLPHREIEQGVTPGNDYPVFQTRFGKVGLMVCYDGFFPEVARELTNRGAEVIAWPVWGCNPLLAQARACENHVYLVSSTYCDSKGNWTISAVYNHAGEPIAKASNWGEIAIAEVDLNERYFWRNNLGDFHSMVQRHRPPPAREVDFQPGADGK
jgi:predicted amidohydrolase